MLPADPRRVPEPSARPAVLQGRRCARDMYYDEDARRRQDRLSQVLGIPVTDFELSVRSRNCLQKMGIMTLGDLTRTSEQELLASKNFGETSLVEIREMLHSKGLELGQFATTRSRRRAGLRPRNALAPTSRRCSDRPICRSEPVGAGPQVHGPAGPVDDRRTGPPHGRRPAGMQELRRHEPQRSPRKADDPGPQAPRRLMRCAEIGAATRWHPVEPESFALCPDRTPSASSSFTTDRRLRRASLQRVHHAARRGRHAGLHAGRHAGHGQGRRPRPAARNRRADDPGQHVSPRAAAGRANGRGARRPARVHGLGRADPHRQRRLSGLQPRRSHDDRRSRRAIPLAHRRRSASNSRPSGPSRSRSSSAATWRWCSITWSRCPTTAKSWPTRCGAACAGPSAAERPRRAATRRCSPSCKAGSTRSCGPNRPSGSWRSTSPATRSAA